MTFQCLVCAFTEMPYAPVPYNICPCCGTEFGVDDHYHSLPEIRQAWIKKGMPWFDDITSPPKNWNAYQQLFDAGFGIEFIRPISHDERVVVRIPDNVLGLFPNLLGYIRPVAA